MNCYTVVNRETQLGIALTRDEGLGTYVLRLGKKKQSAGHEKKVLLAPSSPASHVLVAGGVRLMRTARLLQEGDKEPQFVFAKARHGLKADYVDTRALVFLDIMSPSSNLGYIPQTYDSVPVTGFEVLQSSERLFRVQGLVVLKPGQNIQYFDATSDAGYTVAYEFNPATDRFPRLSCMPSAQFRVRESKKLTPI